MCNSHSRRAFVIGGLSSVMIGDAADAQFRAGMACGAAMGGTRLSGFTSTTGNVSLDKAIIGEVLNIKRLMPTNPTVKFFDDSQSPNAFAVEQAGTAQLPVQMFPGTWGLVCIGLRLLKDELIFQTGGIALAGIIAHEVGHIWQFQFPGLRGMLASQTNRNIELHADYLAGVYFGRDGRRNINDIEVFSRSLFSKGSYDYNNPDFHGTPNSRVDAMKMGYRMAQAGRDVGDVSYDGIEIVRKLP
jgi:hypothetical protein